MAVDAIFSLEDFTDQITQWNGDKFELKVKGLKIYLLDKDYRPKPKEQLFFKYEDGKLIYVGLEGYVDNQDLANFVAAYRKRIKKIIEDGNVDKKKTVQKPADKSTKNLEAFVKKNKGGLRNDKDEVAAVYELQRFLMQLGLDTGGHDGKYGPKTNAAVLEFQKSRGLVTDGDAGANTIKEIVKIRRDFATIEKLIAKLNEGTILKSAITRALYEADLSKEELEILGDLQEEYADFVEDFPEFEAETIEKISDVIASGGKSTVAKTDDKTDDAGKNNDTTKDAGKNDDETSMVKPEEEAPPVDSELENMFKPKGSGDGEETDGEETDGEKTDGEKTDGEKTDGEKTDGEKTDGEEEQTKYQWRKDTHEVMIPSDAQAGETQALKEYNNLVKGEKWKDAYDLMAGDERIPPSRVPQELLDRLKLMAKPDNKKPDSTSDIPEFEKFQFKKVGNRIFAKADNNKFPFVLPNRKTQNYWKERQDLPKIFEIRKIGGQNWYVYVEGNPVKDGVATMYQGPRIKAFLEPKNGQMTDLLYLEKEWSLFKAKNGIK
jgi:peptidoglycan hydrolase-like protein with peptidoglycan-binding domain